MRVVYMGTPEIAAKVLEAVHELPVEIVGVWTQPDKPVGRKQVLTPPPVKVLAEQYGIPVYQPERIKRKAAVAELEALRPDLILVTAYGQLLSEKILNIPPLGCINMHASLLPKYRGAAPIQWVIVNGEKETGVTAMMMDKGMDTGDMLIKRTVAIAENDTAETLYDKLAEEGGALIKEVVSRLLAGETLPREKQNDDEATYAPIIQKEHGLIDWSKGACQIEQMVRGFYSWPCAYTMLEDKKLTVLKAHVFSEEECEALATSGVEVGSVLSEGLAGKRKKLLVHTGNGVLQIDQLQLQGKKAMEADAFLRGCDLTGKKLG